MFEFMCSRCGYIYNEKEIYCKHSGKDYCLNCYTILYGEKKEKDARKRKRYNKEPKKLIKAWINTKDCEKISDINISEFVRKSVEYVVSHPLLKDKIIGE